MISDASTKRGPGRLKYALPSNASTRPERFARNERHCGTTWSSAIAALVFGKSKPHGATITASGSEAAIASHSKRFEFNAGIRQYRLTAGKLDQFGNPMTGAHRRIGPLQHERTRRCVATL